MGSNTLLLKLVQGIGFFEKKVLQKVGELCDTRELALRKAKFRKAIG